MIPQKKPHELSAGEKSPKDMNTQELVMSQYLLSQVAKTLPNVITPERFMRNVITEFNKNPKLWDCSKHSIATAIMKSASYGLNIDGRNCYAIPYNGECQLIVGYMGLITLVRRSGEIAKIHADVVYTNDMFEENLGEIVKHVPQRSGSRGEIKCVYAMAVLKDGSQQAVVMDRGEIESIRTRSKSGANGPWKTDWSEMAKKVCFKRLVKWLPLSYDIAETVDQDSRVEYGSCEPASPTTSLNEKLNAQDSDPIDISEPSKDEGDF